MAYILSSTGDQIIVFLMLIIMIGILVTNWMMRYMYRKHIGNISEYYDRKAERARKFADSEEDEQKKQTYRALQCAWEKAREVAEKEL